MFYTAKVKRKFLTQRRGGAKYAERNKNLGTDPVRPLILLAIVGSVPKDTVMGVNCRLWPIGNVWRKMERMDTEAV